MERDVIKRGMERDAIKRGMERDAIKIGMERDVIKISARLTGAAKLTGNCSVLADIGCDHGRLSAYMIQKGLASRVIAMDVAPGPLARAEELIKSLGLSEKITLRLSDGGRELAPGEADAAVITGMGGMLIRRIITESPEVFRAMDALVLGPQSDLPALRSFLASSHYATRSEDLVFEDGKFYQLLRVSYAGAGGIEDSGCEGVEDSGCEGVEDSNCEAVEDSVREGIEDSGCERIEDSVREGVENSGFKAVSSNNSELCQPITGSGFEKERYLHYGNLSWHPLYPEYMEYEKRRLSRAMAALDRAKDTAENIERREQLEFELTLCS